MPYGPILDRSGYVVSLPAPGRYQRMACVEISSDRKLSKQIAEGEYQDCKRWAQGEARRRRFGDGCEPSLAENEPQKVGGVGQDFRWRKWDGLNKELRREMKRRAELNEADTKAKPLLRGITGQSAYSVSEKVPKHKMAEKLTIFQSIPGETCHQCRRKSEKLKMKCRNVNPICRANFCETCCKRYVYCNRN